MGLTIGFIVSFVFYLRLIAMVMADVSVVTDLMAEEEKKVKHFLENLGQKLKAAGVSVLSSTRTV